MQVRYQTAPRSDTMFFLFADCGACPGTPRRHHTPFAGLADGCRAQRRRIRITSSSSMRTWRTICWLWVMSVRASSPVSF